MLTIILNIYYYTPYLVVCLIGISTLIAIVSKIRHGQFFERLIFGYLYFLPWITNIALALTIAIPIKWGEEGVIIPLFWVFLNILALIAMIVQLVILEIKNKKKN